MSLISYSCAPDWSAIDTFGLFYNWYLMALGFFLPTVVVVTSNICVFYVSRKVFLYILNAISIFDHSYALFSLIYHI